MNLYLYRFDLDTQIINPYNEKAWYETIPTYIKKVSKNPTIVSKLDIEVGQKAYIVWVIWSCGTPHTSDYYAGTRVFGIFKSKNVANELVEYLKNRKINCDGSEDYDICEIFTSDTQYFKLPYLSWLGPYDRLEKLHIQQVNVVDEGFG